MTVEAADLKRLESAIAGTRRSRLGRLASRPLHLGYSKAVEVWCKSRRTALPVVARTFWGEPFHAVLPERVSMTIFRYGFFEEELTRTFLRFLKPGMVFFDVGSHFGYFSLLALRLVGPTGQVHAFDPTPSTFQVLSKNLAGRPNVRLNNAAAYSSDDTLTFNDFGVEYSAFNSLYAGKIERDERRGLTPRSVQVNAVALDGYIARTGVVPDFLKIDAEGAELDILRGMERTLAEKRPMLTLEVGDIAPPSGAENLTPSRDVVKFMLDRGYRGLEHRPEAGRGGGEGTFVDHVLRDRYDYQNILFVPR